MSSVYGKRRPFEMVRGVVMIGAALLAVAGYSAEAQGTDANTLLVEAGRLIIDARRGTPEERVDRLELAREKLERIIDNHPSTDAAVRLATGQGVGSVSLEAIESLVAQARRACWGSTSVACISQVARDFALSVENCDTRVHLLTKIGWAQGSVGDLKRAKRTLDLADTNALSCESDHYRGVDRQIHGALIYQQRIIAGQFEEGGDRLATSLPEYASGLPTHLALPASVETVYVPTRADLPADAPLIDVRVFIERVLRWADAAEKRPSFAQARTAAQLIEDGTERLGWTVAIALAQADVSAEPHGFIEEALAAARRIDDGHERARRLAYVARAQWRAGDAPVGLATLAAAEDAIPEAHFGESPDLAYWRVRLLISAARTHAQLGDRESVAEATAEALRHIDAIAELPDRLDLIRRAASANVDAARLHAAVEIAGRIPDNHQHKALLYAEIGNAHDAAGDRQAARGAFASAVRFAQGVEDAYQRLFAYWNILGEQASPRYLKSRETAASVAAAGKELQDEGKPALARSLVLLANARINGRARGAARELESIIRVASGTDDESLKVDLLLAACAVQSALGQFSAALETARLIEDPRWRARAFGRVARWQAEAKMSDAAEETARLILQDEEYWTLSPLDLADVASAQVQAGSVPYATMSLLTASQKMSVGSYHPAVWAAIARVYADIVDVGENLSGGSLGVQLSNATESMRDGVRVSRVLEDTPAAVAGIESGDVVVRIDGEDVTDAAGVLAHVGQAARGDPMVFGLLRDGERREATAVVESVRDSMRRHARAALERALEALPFVGASRRSSSLARIASAYAELGRVEEAERTFSTAHAAAMAVVGFDDRRRALVALAATQDEAQVESTAAIDSLYDMLLAQLWLSRFLDGSTLERRVDFQLDVQYLAAPVVARRPDVLDSYIAFVRKQPGYKRGDGLLDLWDEIRDEIRMEGDEFVAEPTDELLTTLSTAATRIANADERVHALATFAKAQAELEALGSAIATLESIDTGETESIDPLLSTAEAFAAVGRFGQANQALRGALALAEKSPSPYALGAILDAAVAVAERSDELRPR